MADEVPEIPSSSHTLDVLQTLAQDISPQTAELAKKLMAAMKNASKEECNAILKVLSKSNKPDFDEKPFVETQGKVGLACGNHINKNDDMEISTPEVLGNSVNGEDLNENEAEVTNGDLNRQEDIKNVSDTGTNELPNESEDREDKCFDTGTNTLVGSQLSNEAETRVGHLPAVEKNCTGDTLGNVSSSEDEKLPELLTDKAEDTCSEIEDGDSKESSEGLPSGVDSKIEETRSLQVDSLTNLLFESTDTGKCYPTRHAFDYDSSSEDDQMAKSSSHSEVASEASELSDIVAPTNAIATQSETTTHSIRNNDDENLSSMTQSRENDIALADDSDALISKVSEEQTVKAPQVMDSMSLSLSKGTQTSSEPDEKLTQDQLAKDQTLKPPNRKDLTSILAMKDQGSSKLPFYYQPQVVLHEEQPVLVLQPVMLSSSNGDVAVVEQGEAKASVPIILPLASPGIDKVTKDAIFEQIKRDASTSSCQGGSKEFLLQSNSHDVLPSLNAAEVSGHNNDNGGEESSSGTDASVGTSLLMEEKPLEGNKTEGLPEWVPSSELDKALSAVTDGATVSSTNCTVKPLTFPSVSLPSTNPFARDLAAQADGCTEVKVDDLSSLGLDKTLQHSLFGPPTSPSLSPGARPKEIKGYQDSAHVSSTTNPFTPDLTSKKRGRRQDQATNEHSTEVVVTADVHPSLGQSADLNRLPQRTPRRRLSSESMVTLIETTCDETITSYSESATSALYESSEITPAQEEPNPQVGSTGMPPHTRKRNVRVPGRVAPFWVPDFASSNCTHCKAKFNMFLRKHHCRGCGKIFCNNCSSQLARFPYMDYKIGRVCPSCTAAIKEAIQVKSSEELSKQQEPRTTPEMPQKTTVPQTRKPSEGLVMSNNQAQRNLVMMPSEQMVTKGQTYPVPQPQAPQGVIMSAQPVNQYTLVPDSNVQPNMPVVLANPVAPSLHGGTPSVSVAPFVPLQAPGVLMTSQPSPPRSYQAATQAVSTMARGGWKGAAFDNRTSSGTVSTFTVLPQQVGQSAVQSAQRRDVASVSQSVPPAASQAVSQASSTATNVSSSSFVPVETSSTQWQSQTSGQLPDPYPTQTVGLPSTTPLQHTFPPPVTVGAAFQSFPRLPTGLAAPLIPSQAQVSAPPVSCVYQSPPLTTSTSVTSERSPQTLANGSRKGSEAQGSPRPREAEGSFIVSDESSSSSKDCKPPLRRAGRTITWRYRTQTKSKLQEQRKSLARDLRDLPNGITVQAAQGLLVHVKKMKLREKQRELTVWCYQSDGLHKFNHLEVVVMLEVRRKEDIFPEEVLRVYRGILHLASKLGNRFEHGNYLSSNEQFLDSVNDAGFIFVSSEVKSKPQGLKEVQTPFLYGILVKRSEIPAAMYTPSRLLLRLGYDMKSFPFPLWNCRDRKPVVLANDRDDRFYHTLFAMNKYLKNSVPEALVPGLYVVKEDKKVILQIPNSGQRVVVSLLDRLIKKQNQTATVPLLSDIPPYIDCFKVVLCNERGGKYDQVFGNTANTSVLGLGFLMLHLGMDASAPLSFGGELLDDGVLVFLSKGHTEKLRQSLKEKTNCYFFLGDKFDISHFELRWMQDAKYHVTKSPQDESHPKETSTNSDFPVTTTAVDTTSKEPGAHSYPGLTTINIRYSGFGSEVEILKKVFDDHTKILHILESNIRQACTEPLMKHENKMKSGEHQDLQMRVVLRPSYKKWSVGPSDLSTALIRSLQIALQTVKVPVVSEGELVMSFDVTIAKQ